MHFSITRLFLAVTAFGIAFGAFSYLGVAGIVVSAVVGLSVGAICLIIKSNQIWPMTRTGLITIFGGFVGLLFCPMNNPGDEIGHIAMCGFVGFVIGISMTASQRPKTDKSGTEPKNK